MIEIKCIKCNKILTGHYKRLDTPKLCKDCRSIFNNLNYVVVWTVEEIKEFFMWSKKQIQSNTTKTKILFYLNFFLNLELLLIKDNIYQSK